MTRGNKLDCLILELLCRKGEISFTDFENEGIMAKSTLNDHLRGLIKEGEARKSMGKTPRHLNHPVYVITAKGRKRLKASKPKGRMIPLDEIFGSS